MHKPLIDTSLELSDGIDEIARLRVRRALRELDPLEERIIRWLAGIGAPQLDDEEIASRLNLSTDAVWRIASYGFAALGFSLITEVAA